MGNNREDPASTQPCALLEPEVEGLGGNRFGTLLVKRMIEGTVDAMVLMVEGRDPFVGVHLRRVSELARAIALELELSPFETEGVRVAALLHDIGKVAIPSEILCKPALLGRAEMRIVRTHPTAARRILRKIPFPWPVAETVYQHAERLDGSGYPRGLAGDEIILPARILGVADTVEAMLTYRPYRPAYSHEDVMAQIKVNGGRLYDRRVTEACLHLFNAKGFRFSVE